MLERTATIKQMFRFVNSQLNSAEWYMKQINLPPKVIDMQVEGFRTQAFGVIFFIYSRLGYNDSHVDYRGIKVPQGWVEYLEKLNN